MSDECLVCNHKWESKSKFGSIRCPNCHSSCYDFGENIPCDICKRICFVPQIHHIDGNRKNNIKENRLPLCLNCHQLVHKFTFDCSNMKDRCFEKECGNRLKFFKVKKLNNLYLLSKSK